MRNGGCRKVGLGGFPTAGSKMELGWKRTFGLGIFTPRDLRFLRMMEAPPAALKALTGVSTELSPLNTQISTNITKKMMKFPLITFRRECQTSPEPGWFNLGTQ